jgi:hypothetical protein
VERADLYAAAQVETTNLIGWNDVRPGFGLGDIAAGGVRLEVLQSYIRVTLRYNGYGENEMY